jgi:hypothetical protein
MSRAVLHHTDLTCDTCGKFGAYAFDGENLCLDCYQSCGSCCAEREISDEPAESAPVATAVAIATDFHRLNPNCCYQACMKCSSIQKLRAFQARFPHDWQSRLRGSERLIRVARERT